MREETGLREPGLTLALSGDPDTVLHVEQLRDGRVAIGVRRRSKNGEWTGSDLYLLDERSCLAMAGWLSPIVEDSWIGTVRERQAAQLRTSQELYGEEADGAALMADAVLKQIPAALMRRALLLLINAIGPETRNRLIEHLNRTGDMSEDAWLRRRLDEEQEAFAYAVAAAALFDVIDRRAGHSPHGLPSE
ncbi:MAG: hypothetical protein H0X65_14405 [Gemmatimonadetes bacterium]|nr:hypothetical protein [Gemmatimonadota bacterium]